MRTNADKEQSLNPGKFRWAAALLIGTVLYVASLIASQFVPRLLGHVEPTWLDWAAIGVFQLVSGLVIVMAALRLVHLSLKDVGLTREKWAADVMIGMAVAIIFALLQFLIIIPATGGAERSDVAVNVQQIGGSVWGVIGMITLAWTGAAMEEIFFRGHFFNTLEGLLGKGRVATIVAALATIALFAAGHGYQGWAGVIDTGIYGGLIVTALYLWRRRLTACIVAHSLWNTIAVIVLFVWY